MNMKLNVTRVLSFSMLLLLPAFAAAGERKAGKTVVSPRITSDGSSFKSFTKVGGKTTQDAAEASGAEGGGAQSTGGAGILSGVMGNGTGQNSSVSGSGRGGGSAAAGNQRPSSAQAPAVSVCAWIPETSPAPSLFPSLSCTSANEGAVSRNSRNQGNFTCVCERGGNSSGQSSAGNPGAGPFSGAAGNLCSKYGITTNTVLPYTGNQSKPLPISTTQGYSFAFNSSARAGAGQARINYISAPVYVSLSESMCDYNQALEAKHCAKKGNPQPPVIYYQTGGISSYACILKPNTVYYYNVRYATPVPNTEKFINTCPGRCSFMIF